MKDNKKTEVNDTPFSIWGVVGSLYITQGIPMGVTFGALPTILRHEGFSTEMIGLLGLVMIPWAIKFLWAPFVDRSSSGSYARRMKWIIPSQLTQASLFMSIAFFASVDSIGFAVFSLLFLANLVSATQDIATDGLAIEIIPKGKFNWVNSVQIGGFSLGMLLGGSVATALYSLGGWSLCFSVLSIITLLTVIPLSRYSRVSAYSTREDSEPASIRKMIKRQGAFYIISIAASFYFARAMAGGMTFPFLVDAGLSLGTIAFIGGIGITTITIISAGLGGLVVNRLGVKKTAIGSGFLAVFTLSLWLIPSYFEYSSLTIILAIVLINGILSGIAYVAFFTLFMRWASTDQPGTDFSLLQSSETITNIMAALLAGVVAGAVGFSVNFLLAAIIGLLIMLWISFALTRISVMSNNGEA